MELTIKLQFKVILQILLDFTVSFAFQLNRAHEEAINSVAVTESSIVFTASKLVIHLFRYLSVALVFSLQFFNWRFYMNADRNLSRCISSYFLCFDYFFFARHVHL